MDDERDAWPQESVRARNPVPPHESGRAQKAGPPGSAAAAGLVCAPIGVIRSPFLRPVGMPIQPPAAEGAVGRVEVLPEYQAGLADLEGFSHIILICHLHKASAFKLKVVPYLDTEIRGLFATRAPSRPNPIGLSVVRLLDINGRRLRIEGIDLLDGTPVLDIKPYIRDFDDETEVRCGWLDGVKGRETAADGRFER